MGLLPSKRSEPVTVRTVSRQNVSNGLLRPSSCTTQPRRESHSSALSANGMAILRPAGGATLLPENTKRYTPRATMTTFRTTAHSSRGQKPRREGGGRRDVMRRASGFSCSKAVIGEGCELVVWGDMEESFRGIGERGLLLPSPQRGEGRKNCPRSPGRSGVGRGRGAGAARLEEIGP